MNHQSTSKAAKRSFGAAKSKNNRKSFANISPTVDLIDGEPDENSLRDGTCDNADR